MKISKHPIDHFKGIARIDENARPSAARLQYSIFKFATYRFQSSTARSPNRKNSVSILFGLVNQVCCFL